MPIKSVVPTWYADSAKLTKMSEKFAWLLGLLLMETKELDHFLSHRKTFLNHTETETDTDLKRFFCPHFRKYRLVTKETKFCGNMFTGGFAPLHAGIHPPQDQRRAPPPPLPGAGTPRLILVILWLYLK